MHGYAEGMADTGGAGHAERNRALFGRVAASYDRLGFLTLAARHLAEQVEVPAGGAVLDVACGTGEVALGVAARGQAGRVVGTDFSPEMVRVAQARAAGRAEFQVADAGALPFPDATFEVVTCGAGLFFLPDMAAALREWRRVLRPGGQVVFTTFRRGLLGDFPGLWRQRLAGEGLTPGSPPLGRVPDVNSALELLRAAGFVAGQARLAPLPYVVPSAEARWADIEAGLEGDPLRALDAGTVTRLRDAHLHDLAPLFRAGPVTVPVPVLLARGRAPGGP